MARHFDPKSRSFGFRHVCALLLFTTAASSHAAPDTGFNYQGRLVSGGMAVNGPTDFTFRLFNQLTGGIQQGSDQVVNDVAVTGGLFSVDLDFGAVWDGGPRYLEIEVSPNAPTVPFTPLSPRQSVSQSPYAILAGAATDADMLDGYHASAFAAAAHAHYLRTIIVSPVIGDAAASGTALETAIAGAPAATAANPVLVSIEPGDYDLGVTGLAVPANVHLRGAGRGVTKIYSQEADTGGGTLVLAGNNQIAYLSAVNNATTGAVTAIKVNGTGCGLSDTGATAAASTGVAIALDCAAVPGVSQCVISAAGVAPGSCAIRLADGLSLFAFNSYFGWASAAFVFNSPASSLSFKDCTFGGDFNITDGVTTRGVVDVNGAILNCGEWTVGPVQGDATASGTRLRNVIGSILNSASSRPYVVKVLPGTYDFGTVGVTVPSYTTLAGSGVKATFITGAVDNAATGLLKINNNTMLRDLSLSNYPVGGTSIGVYASGAGIRLQDLDIIAGSDTAIAGTATGINYSSAGSSFTRNITLSAYASGACIGLNLTSCFDTQIDGVEVSATSTAGQAEGIRLSGCSAAGLAGGAFTVSAGTIGYGLDLTSTTSGVIRDVVATASGGSEGTALNFSATGVIGFDSGRLTGSTNAIQTTQPLLSVSYTMLSGTVTGTVTQFQNH